MQSLWQAWVAEPLDAAGTAFGVDHSTVFRRLKACEARLDTVIFDRRGGRYEPTAEDEQVIRQAAATGKAVHQVECTLTGDDARLSGTLRITMPDTLALLAMPRHLRTFSDRYPNIILEVAVSNQFLLLSRRDADIALRPVMHTDGAMVGRRLATIAFALYGARSYLTGHGRPIRPSSRTIT